MLRARRKARDLTQPELADLVSCSPSLIRMIELGERRASRQLAELLADYLKVAPDAREEFLQAARVWPVAGQHREAAGNTEEQASLALDLPTYLTPMVGREEEIKAIEIRLLSEDRHRGVRLLTLIGPAGVGKTRLASAIASGWQSRFRDGARFVALASVRVPAMVIPAIAGALGVREQREHNDAALLEALKKHLQGKEMLLVLDNMEQVIEAGSAIASVLGACPGVKALVTSREPLHVRGESVFPVPTLSLPDLENFPPVEALSAYSAVALFVDRAQRSVPSFALREDNAHEIATICARMDGLPLAIELVAARVKLFSPRMLLSKLEGAHGLEAFRLLGDGARDLPERHRTLQAAIGWSYNLLSKEERTLFVRLGVFVGGCTLPAIEAVCNAATDLRLDPLYGISSLLDKSLVKIEQEEGGNEEPRFQLLETVREYAVSQLEAREEGEAAGVRRWHAEYFLALVEAAEPGIVGKEQEVWFRRLERDHENIQAALAWLLEHEGAELAARLAGAVSNFWLRRAQLEARRWLYLILEQRQFISPVVLSRVLQAACTLAVGSGNLSQAQVLAEENLDVARSIGDRASIIGALVHLGVVAGERGDFAQSELSYSEGLRLAQETSDEASEVQITNRLGEIARALGDYERARTLYKSSLRLARETGNNWYIAVTLHNVGRIALAMANPAEAKAQLRESLGHFNELGSRSGAAYCLAALGEAAVHMEAWERAVTLFSASDALLNSLGLVMERVDRAGRDAALEQAHEKLDPTIFRAAWEAGRSLLLDQAVDYARDCQAI